MNVFSDYRKGQQISCSYSSLYCVYVISIFRQGCRCDVFSHFYCISTDLKYDWDDLCSTQPSILAYAKDVIRKHRLEPFITLNTKVVLAEWQSESQAYKVITEDAKGDRSTLTANVIVSATGILHIPRMPTIPGIESFQGKIFHSSRWDTSVDLRGKRVAVIGNGSSGLVDDLIRCPHAPNTQADMLIPIQSPNCGRYSKNRRHPTNTLL